MGVATAQRWRRPASQKLRDNDNLNGVHDFMDICSNGEVSTMTKLADPLLATKVPSSNLVAVTIKWLERLIALASVAFIAIGLEKCLPTLYVWATQLFSH